MSGLGTALSTAVSANPIGAGAAALGVGAQIFSAIKGGQANKANQKLLDRRYKENESFYNNNVNKDFLQTNAAKGMFERLRKNLRDSNKVVDNSAAVHGGTAEATIAAKSKNQENHNNSVNDLAQKATQYQQNQEAIYRGEKANLDNQQMQINRDKAANAANLAGNAANLVTAGANIPGKIS